MVQSAPLRVPANDFARQWRDIRDEAIDAVERVGRSGWLILGKEVSTFEHQLAEWWGVRYAVGVASGLDALEIGIRCSGIPAEADVLTTPFSAFATTLAILRSGRKPVWCDVDESGGLDLDQVDAALCRHRSIRAVMPVHLYGHPIDPAALEGIAADHGVVIIEDCAQSVGAECQGRPTGAVGLVAGTSLYPTKNLGAMGDAGVLLTGSEEIAERARSLRDYGQRERYWHVEEGLNSRLDELHAAILRTALLPRLDRWLERRREIAGRYSEALEGTCLRPIVAHAGRSAHHLFPVEVLRGSISEIANGLMARGVAPGRHYPFVACDQPAAQGRGMVLDDLPVARRLAERELSLPIHPYLQDPEVEHVIEACLDVCA